MGRRGSIGESNRQRAKLSQFENRQDFIGNNDYVVLGFEEEAKRHRRAMDALNSGDVGKFEELRNDLLTNYVNYCISLGSKYFKRHKDEANHLGLQMSDFVSEAMVIPIETFTKFDSERGRFMGFLKMVINQRLSYFLRLSGRLGSQNQGGGTFREKKGAENPYYIPVSRVSNAGKRSLNFEYDNGSEFGEFVEDTVVKMPFDQIESEERVGILMNGLERLSDQERNIVFQRVWEGRTHGEIGREHSRGEDWAGLQYNNIILRKLREDDRLIDAA